MTRIGAGAPLVTMIALGACLTACAGDPRSADSEALIDAVLAADAPGCAAAAAVDGDVVWSYERGLADVDRSAAIKADTRFNIGSVSKQFTALSALSLADDGLIDLDAPVSEYLDGLPAWSDEATVLDLMGHSAGIIDPSHSVEEEVTRDVLFDDLVTDQTTYRGGDDFLYSNTGYMLLGMIIEEVTGDSLATWMRTHVFEPAGVDMAVEGDQGAATESVGYASSTAPFRIAADHATIIGPTGVLATASELARWGDEYRSHTVVSSEALAAAIDRGTPLDDGLVYGPGIFVWPSGLVTHSGEDDGFTAYFATDPSTGTTITLTCNHPVEEQLAYDLADVWVPVGPVEDPASAPRR